MKIALFLLLIACLLGCQANSEIKEDKPKEELPNIVLMIGDDHGYPYFGFMGADYVETPNMDEVAKSGIVFTDGYVPDNHCRPSLATLVTGKLPVDYKNKVEKLIKEKGITEQAEKVEFDHQSMKNFTTLPRLLKERGYKTFQGGKWWEFHYENGGFSDGMTKGWTKEDKKNGGNGSKSLWAAKD